MVPRQPDSLPAAVTAGNERLRPRNSRQRAVFESLLNDISSGRLRPGDRFPSEGELSRRFAASRPAVARAMRELKDRGLLHEHRGGGSTVSATLSRRIALFAPFAQAVAGLGFMGANIYAHLANLASHRGDHLSLQLISRAGENPLPQMIESADRLIKNRVDGVFYYPIELPGEHFDCNRQVVERLQNAGLSVVLIDRDILPYPQRSNLPLIKYDNFRGGYLLTDHLIQQGRTRIAYVGIGAISSAATDRLRGYCSALRAHRLPVDSAMVHRASLPELNADFWKKLLDQSQPQAVVCNSDRYAALLGRHLESVGLKIGKDILIAGFGNQPFSEMLSTPLTTIRFPLTPFAAVCYDRLLWQIQNQAEPVPGHTQIDVEIMIRESTGRL